MAKTDTSSTRAPRGTKPVALAFFTALDATPEASRAAIGKAALALIRDEMKMKKEKMKIAAAKEKEKARKALPEKPPATPKVKAKPAAVMKGNGAEHPPAPVKRRARKPADAPTPES